MYRLTLTALIMLVVLPAIASAQGSGSSARKSDFTVTRSVDGTIAEIKREENVVVVKEEDGTEHPLVVHEKTRFKADRNTALARNPALGLADFEVGQSVRITFVPATHEVEELRLRSKG